MIKIYKFDYDMMEASVKFEVDTEKFTPQLANDTLTFFLWDYDKNGDPVDEAVRKYALRAIIESTLHDHNTEGVIADFNDGEGFYPIDGSCGIKLLHVEGYTFDENKLEVKVLEK
ncbi:DUF2528 family protein [Leeuwenhoekiella sp. A16]|uniref:DUF2528 family protein n=1 Tax=Leeuwenhoekiella sp. A16 TaxID=3141462 RepID=UPI003A80FC4D